MLHHVGNLNYDPNEKLLDAINKQRGGPRKWGKIAEIFPDRTRKATEVHGMKLLMKVYGTTTTDVLDDSNLTLLCPKPSRKWTHDENEMIHHVLQTMDIANGDCWEKHIDQFRDRTVPELQLRAKYLMEKADAGIPIREDNDDDFIGYGMAMEKAPVFVAWSKEEDDMLEKLTINLPEGSGRWEAVVKMFPGRTRRAVISHARRLWAKKNGGGISLNLSGDDLEVPVGVDESPERIVVELPPQQLQQLQQQQQVELSPVAPPAASTKKRATKKLRSLQYNEVNAAPLSAVPMEPVPSSDSEEDKDVYKVKTLWSFLEEETLLQLMQEYPNRQYDWVEIGKHFPGRTRRAVECHGIKLLRDINRFNRHFAEFRTGGRRPKIMWTQDEEETLLAAMEQHQGKGRWYEIAKLFPGRSKQAIECHGVTLAKQIRMKSEKYQIPLPPMMLEVVGPPPPMQHLPPMMVNAPGMQMQPPNALDSNSLSGILSNNNPGTISMEMPHAMSVGVVPAHAAASHLVDVMHGGGILDGDMTGESLEHFENVLLEAAASSIRAIPTSRSKQWSLEEDEALKSAVQAVQGHHWSKIALMIPGKTAQQCLGRWRTLNPSISHEPWTEEEDELLKSLVQRYTVDDKVRWAKVAQHLPGRRDTQCRARWCYNVNPELNLSAWSDDELKTFLLLKHELGNRWTEMEKRLPGRSVNALLSRWHCVKRRLEYFVCLKLGTSKDQLLKDVENYDFEKFFPTIEFTEDDAAEMVRVMKAGSFVGYKIAKSRASGAESIALSSLPPIRPSMSVEDQRRLVRAAASAASLNDGADDDSSVSELPTESA
eukprot:gene364-240_t